MKTYKQLQERINMAKAKMGDVIKDFQASDAPQFKGKSQEKRRQMAIAAKMAAEEVELEEEQLDEISTNLAISYRGKAGEDKTKDRSKGRKLALDKWSGKARVPSGKYNEEVELEEGRMKEIAMDIESMGDKEFKEKHKKSKQDMKDSLKSEELKGNQHKIDANKNGKIDGHDFKLLRGKKKVEESSDLKPFIVVHAKHGKFETHAGSTYEAAKNAAAHWKTKKGTAGMDVHRADITHSTQHVG
jgi:Mg-chelatase subunit ChlI